MISSDEYAALTGEESATDFAACEALAAEIIHAHTLYAYAGREPGTLPEWLAGKLKQAVALQAMALCEAGGVRAAAGQPAAAMSLGSFSVSGQADGAASTAADPCPAVLAMLPVLIAAGRGLAR